jgi:hypothetical protein
LNRVLLLCLILLGASSIDARQAAGQSDEDLSIQAFLQAIETTISTTDGARWRELLSPNADRDAAIEFFDSMVPWGARAHPHLAARRAAST